MLFPFVVQLHVASSPASSAIGNRYGQIVARLSLCDPGQRQRTRLLNPPGQSYSRRISKRIYRAGDFDDSLGFSQGVFHDAFFA
jgi:hypothetical protein